MHTVKSVTIQEAKSRSISRPSRFFKVADIISIHIPLDDCRIFRWRQGK